MLWVVVPQAEQLGKLLAQQGDQRLSLTLGVCPEDRHRRLLGLAMDVAAAELLDQGSEQGAKGCHRSRPSAAQPWRNGQLN